MAVMSELGNLLDSIGSLSESSEDGKDVRSLLHRNDTELVLFVNPGQELLLFVMEDTSASGPVTVETAGVEEAVTFLEKEVIFDKLLSVNLSHGAKSIVLALKLAIHLREGA